MKKEEESQIDPNAWMVTFSDLLSLLMTFFVLLLAMSSMDNKKLEETIGAFKSYLGVLELGDSIKVSGLDNMDASIIRRYKLDTSEDSEASEDDELGKGMIRGVKASVKRELKLLVEAGGWDKDIEISSDLKSMVVVFREGLLYDPGSTELTSDAMKILKNLAFVLKRTRTPIKVEGHTDNRPAYNSGISVWDLSIARAVTVVEMLELFGVNPAMLSASGYGDSRPAVNNIGFENRKMNRRVEVKMDLFKDDN